MGLRFGEGLVCGGRGAQHVSGRTGHGQMNSVRLFQQDAHGSAVSLTWPSLHFLQLDKPYAGSKTHYGSGNCDGAPPSLTLLALSTTSHLVTSQPA